jgi:hypothetical protein
MRRLRRTTYFGGLAPPLPPPDPPDGGLTPPVPGSTPPPLPWLPPVPPVPLDGACGAGAGAGVTGAGVAVPPLDPDPGVDEPELPDFLFFLEVDGVVTPESGVVVGWKLGTGFGFDPPPPDAIAITTMRKKTTMPPRATSLRRR